MSAAPALPYPAELGDLPLFRFMSEDVRRLVGASFERVAYSFGQVIVREGEQADAFFVIVSGSARAIKRGESGEEVALNVLGPGDGFGELALLEDTHRTATVRASSAVEALRLDAAVVRALVGSNPEVREYFELYRREHHLRDFFKTQSVFGRMPSDALALMLRELEPVDVSAGAVVLREGDPSGPMYVVEEGRLAAYQGEGEKRQALSFLRRGDFFGERSLMLGEDRSATVEAVSDCKLLRLSPDTFQRLVSSHPGFREQIEQRISQYDYMHAARVPLDFAEEILPGDVGAPEAVAPEQTDDPAEELPEDGGGLFGRPAKRLRRFPHVWQVDEADCGAASVAMICRHFGRSVSLAHIRHVVHTTVDGTSLVGITRGAESLGLATRAIKASKSRLDEMPLPAIVHWGGNHWVVLFDVDSGHVRVSDPGRGVRRVKRSEFEERWSGYAALLAPTPEFENAPVQLTDVGWIWDFFRPYRGTMLRALLLALAAAGLQMVIPIFSKVIVDSVIADADYGLLTILVLAMAGTLVLMIAASVLQRYILSRAAVRIDASTLDFLTGKLLALPMSYFNARRTGDIEQRLGGMRQVRQLVVESGVAALTAGTQFAAAIVVMFVFSWQLALVYLATVPLYAALMRFSSRRLRPMFDTLEEAFGRYQSRQIDAIKGIETVKAMGAEPQLRGLLVGQFNSLAHRIFRADFTVMLYEASIQLVAVLSLALFLWVGALQVLDGNLTIGGLVSFNALVALANGPVSTFLSLWDQAQMGRVLLNRMNDIFEQEPEQGEDHSALRPVSTLEGRIRFEGVGFQYGGAISAPILQDLTFEVHPGETVAVVGRSGSGKTTLIKCLAGLLEPTEGTIYYDGLDLRTLRYSDLRRQIGFVLQENYLFDDTIARNIAFGDDKPDMEQVAWAAKIAAAHDFVERLPLAYDTRVGETGLLLSGGQRQRLAIARALYHKPPILIFDEATSALDTESERAVKGNMDRLLEGRTAFVIAHRLSTIRDADRIVVLERGRLAEQGTHDELIARQGLYYYLSSQQLEL